MSTMTVLCACLCVGLTLTTVGVLGDQPAEIIASVQTSTVLGCYVDVPRSRDLDGLSYGWATIQANTQEKCINLCQGAGFHYAGLQNGHGCHCGNKYGKYGNGTGCDRHCQGNSTENCGGWSFNMIIYIAVPNPTSVTASGSVTLSNEVYTPDMQNSSSDAFKQKQTKLCGDLQSGVGNQATLTCNATSFSPGPNGNGLTGTFVMKASKPDGTGFTLDDVNNITQTALNSSQYNQTGLNISSATGAVYYDDDRCLLTTANDALQDTGLSLNDVTSVVFQLKTTNLASIALTTDTLFGTSDESFTNNVYLINISAVSSINMFIGDNTQNPPVNSQSTSGVLDANSYLWFWISWTGGNVQVGQGQAVGSKMLVSSSTATPLSIVSMAIATSTTGYWEIKSNYYTFPSPIVHACEPPAIPVNGNWSSWSWSNCSVTCENGTMNGTRTCTNPPPSNGGLDCIGNSTTTTTCIMPSCPIPANCFVSQPNYEASFGDVGISLNGTTSLVFLANAAADAELLFLTSTGVRAYRVNIGGNLNQVSTLTYTPTDQWVIVPTPSVLQPGSYQWFWASWTNGTCMVGKGKTIGQNVLFSYTPSPLSTLVIDRIKLGAYANPVHWIIPSRHYTGQSPIGIECDSNALAAISAA